MKTVYLHTFIKTCSGKSDWYIYMQFAITFILTFMYIKCFNPFGCNGSEMNFFLHIYQHIIRYLFRFQDLLIHLVEEAADQGDFVLQGVGFAAFQLINDDVTYVRYQLVIKGSEIIIIYTVKEQCTSEKRNNCQRDKLHHFIDKIVSVHVLSVIITRRVKV